MPSSPEEASITRYPWCRRAMLKTERMFSSSSRRRMVFMAIKMCRRVAVAL